MNEFITVSDGKLALSKEASKSIAEIEKTIKALKAKEDEMKAEILKGMEINNILKLETDDIVVSYIASTGRETFDSKKFRADNPDLYDEYVSISPVKSSIRIKVK
jgi:regulator of replication initiation timing